VSVKAVESRLFRARQEFKKSGNMIKKELKNKSIGSADWNTTDMGVIV